MAAASHFSFLQAAAALMLDKVKGIEERYSELERQLSDPATTGNSREFARLAKERSQLHEIVECIRDYRHHRK